MEPLQKLLFTRQEAAAMLSVSTSTLDMMVAQGMIRAVRKGRRVLLHKNELARAAMKNFPRIWPPKRVRKTVEMENAASA